MALLVSTAAGKELNTESIDITHLDKKQRLKRASKTSGIIVGVGVAFIFVPILHFFVPPAAFLTAIVIFIQRYSEQVLLTAESFSCLHCKFQFPIHQGGQSIEDSFFGCPSCSQRHYIALPKP